MPRVVSSKALGTWVRTPSAQSFTLVSVPTEATSEGITHSRKVKKSSPNAQLLNATHETDQTAKGVRC